MMPAFRPTDRDRARVRALVVTGIAQDDIARVVGISPPTLRKHFRQELDVALLEANARVSGELFDAATNAVVRVDVLDENGDPTGRKVVREIRDAGIRAAMWWTKARMGWGEAGSGSARRVGKRRDGPVYDEPPLLPLIPGTENL